MSNYDYVINYLPICKAAILDDWDSASPIFEQDPDLMTKHITYWSETPLMVAISTNRSHHFVKKLVERIVAVGDHDKLFVTNSTGRNPLHYAAIVGNTIAARLLLEHNPNMTLVPDEDDNTPLILAASHGNKETLKFLLTMTRGFFPVTGVVGRDLITLTLAAGFYDVALDIVDMHPELVLEEDRNGQTALQILAMKPQLFPSGTSLGFWGRVIYSLIPTNTKKYQGATQVKILSTIYNKFTTRFWSALRHVGIIWYNVGGFYLFRAAIKQRQERVYNLVYQMSGHKVFAARELNDEENENALHMAAKLAPPHRLKVVTGAALQMQRELQWFQEVEKFIEPSYKEALDKNGNTPRTVFTNAHKELRAEGQQWMKDAASSCTVVAALIVTMAFAAVFTVPGGNQDDGKPLFQKKTTFLLFIVSDAVALFSSSTSVLMFLGILTSRYAEDDFLYALPKRLTIGLLSLFMSLVATMIAFSSAMAIVLQGEVTWIAAPLVTATSVPVCLFGLLQFPLLVEMFNSTYGRSIFHQ